VGAGIFLMLTTMMWFLVLDTIAKELLTRAGLPLVQVVWARFFFHFLIGTAFILFLWPRRVHSQKPGLQLVRSALLLSTTALFNAGLSHSSLATATTIMFLTPIVLTVLSVFVLGEHVGPRRWLGVAFGFLGALIVVRPGMEGFNAGTLYFLAAAATNSAYQLTTRQLSGFDDPRTSFFYTAMVGTVGSSLAVPFAWETPDAFEWTLLVGMGLIGGIGHLFLVLAFDKAPASALAPFSYSALVWAALFGFVFFDEIPDFWTMVGAGLITGSGLYIFYRERVVQRQAIPARG
jgi:drug/metabolite transporter (DMT)-like permease